MPESIEFTTDIPLLDGTHKALDVAPAERRDAAENRARILRAAEALFAENDVTAVTMSDIARAAGVGKGTLYRRFANKGELCLGLMDGRLRAFQDATLAQLRTLHAQRMPQMEQVRRILQEIVHFTEAHTPLLRVVQQNGVMGGSETTSPHFVWQYLTIRGLLRAAVQAGELAADVDVDVVADALLAPLHAPFYTFLRQDRGFSPQRICDGLWILITNLPPGTARADSCTATASE